MGLWLWLLFSDKILHLCNMTVCQCNFLDIASKYTPLTLSQLPQRPKDKFRYCRLSPNHKFLHYDDCDEKSVPTLDELGKKISIVDIKSVVTGKECPHMKEKAGWVSFV